MGSASPTAGLQQHGEHSALTIFSPLARARARGWAARCCSTCSSRLGGAAAAGRTMVRSTAAPSPVLFRGILCSQIRGDDGARAVRPMMTSASPGRDGGDGDGAGRARSEVPGRRQRSPNSAALTVGTALTTLAAVSRARGARRPSELRQQTDPAAGAGRRRRPAPPELQTAPPELRRRRGQQPDRQIRRTGPEKAADALGNQGRSFSAESVNQDVWRLLRAISAVEFRTYFLL
jgi:hypothetical protein